MAPTSPNTVWQRGSRAWPCRVNAMPRPLRSNNLALKMLSISLSIMLAAEGDMASRSAVAANEPRLASSSIKCNCLMRRWSRRAGIAGACKFSKN